MKAITASGKRKSALAKVVLKEGKRLIKINSMPYTNYFSELGQQRIKELIILSEGSFNKININVNVKGGGLQGQLEASRLAMARALVKYNKKLKKIFSDYDKHLLVADVRRRETRKPNASKGARSKRQKSYR